MSHRLKVDDAHPQTTEAVNWKIDCWLLEDECLHECSRKAWMIRKAIERHKFVCLDSKFFLVTACYANNLINSVLSSLQSLT